MAPVTDEQVESVRALVASIPPLLFAWFAPFPHGDQDEAAG